MPDVLKKIADLDFDFVPHPASGDIVTLKDGDAVKRAIRNLMFTGKNERLFQPNLGANLKQLLFEPMTPATELSIELLVRDTIIIYEPRASIIKLRVTASEDESGYSVFLVFSVDQVSEFVSVDLFLERLR
jgi:phage baseplate assembly protein W